MNEAAPEETAEAADLNIKLGLNLLAEGGLRVQPVAHGLPGKVTMVVDFDMREIDNGELTLDVTIGNFPPTENEGEVQERILELIQMLNDVFADADTAAGLSSMHERFAEGISLIDAEEIEDNELDEDDNEDGEEEEE